MEIQLAPQPTAAQIAEACANQESILLLQSVREKVAC